MRLLSRVCDGAAGEKEFEHLFETLEDWQDQLKHSDALLYLEAVDGLKSGKKAVPESEIEPPSGPDFGGPQP